MQIKTAMWYHLTWVRMVIIKKSTNNKCWRGCEEKGMLLHCWWECKLIQPIWKTVWRFLKKLGIKPPYDPAIPLLGIYPEEIKIEKAHVSHCSLHQYLKQLEHGSNLDVHQDIYTMEYYSAIKRNTFELVLMSWMDLEPIIQSEVSQKDKYHSLTHMYGIQENGTEEFI